MLNEEEKNAALVIKRNVCDNFPIIICIAHVAQKYAVK